MSGCHEEISCNTELSTPHPAVLYRTHIKILLRSSELIDPS